MPEYRPPCSFGPCPERGEMDDSGRRLCSTVAESMIRAGGAGVLEINFCPLSAIFSLGPEQDDSHMAEVRKNLGIVGYTVEGDDLFG